MPGTPDPSEPVPAAAPVPADHLGGPPGDPPPGETTVIPPGSGPGAGISAAQTEFFADPVIDPSAERVREAVPKTDAPSLGLMASFAEGFRVPDTRYDVMPTARRRRITHDQIIELYHAHHDGLVRFAALVAPEDGMAEDLVQEAFVRLYKSWGRIRDPEKVPAYMRSTIANLARGRGRHLAVATRNRPEPGPDAASAEQGALEDERRDEVVRLLRTLPARQRECLVLRYYQGLNETEIAATLKISVGSVRTHTSRGMAALQQRVTAFTGEQPPGSPA